MFGTQKLSILDSAPMTFKGLEGAPGVLQIGDGIRIGGKTYMKITFDPIDRHISDRLLFDKWCDEDTVRKHFGEFFAVRSTEARSGPPPKATPTSDGTGFTGGKIGLPGGFSLDLKWSSMARRDPSWYTDMVWSLEDCKPAALHGVPGVLKWSSGAWHKIIFEPLDDYWMPYRLRDFQMTDAEAREEFNRFSRLLTP